MMIQNRFRPILTLGILAASLIALTPAALAKHEYMKMGGKESAVRSDSVSKILAKKSPISDAFRDEISRLKAETTVADANVGEKDCNCQMVNNDRVPAKSADSNQKVPFAAAKTTQEAR